MSMRVVTMIVVVLVAVALRGRIAQGDPGCSQRDAQLTGTRTVTSLEPGFWNDTLYVVVGPGGDVRGSLPASIPEDTDIHVLVHRPSASRYAVAITGCERPAARVLGAPVDVDPTLAPAGAALVADDYPVGRCSADHAVRIEIQIEYAGCAAHSKTVELRTTPVYRFLVGYGAAFTTGSGTDVGVDLGAGGRPAQAYEREARTGLSDRVLVSWLPFAFAPGEAMFDTPAAIPKRMLRRVLIGTLIDPSHALSSVSVVGGAQVVSGLAVFAGSDLCRKERRLGGGLVDGAIYAGDSSALPTRERWECDPHVVVGIAATADVVAKLFTE